MRIPDNPIAVALAEELGNPLLSTSITLGADSGMDEIEPESIEMEYESNPEIELMINGGTGALTGSTVVDLSDSRNPEIIRQGAGYLQD